MQSGRKAILSGALLLGGILFGWVPAVAAQQGRLTGLTIGVTFANDRPVTMRLRVQLTHQSGLGIEENFTDERGQVHFDVA